jgi:hypothetical protein
VATPRRAVRVRRAKPEEKAAAGVDHGQPAKAILLSLCTGTIKVIVTDRPLPPEVLDTVGVLATAGDKR